jgi:hypothetical protein
MLYRVILLFIDLFLLYYILYWGIYYLGGHFNVEKTVVIDLLQAVLRYMHRAPPDKACISFKIYHWF